MSVVLITGCSTGIGFATAILVARSGHTVYATMRNPSRSALPQLSEGGLSSLKVIQLDVNNEASVNDTVDRVIKQEGKIDVLVNAPESLPSSIAVSRTKAVSFKNWFEID